MADSTKTALQKIMDSMNKTDKTDLQKALRDNNIRTSAIRKVLRDKGYTIAERTLQDERRKMKNG